MRVKTKEAFITRAHRVISKGAGEIINMPEEDYEEVKDKVILLDKTIKEVKETKETKKIKTNKIKDKEV